jgi:hypothetical protein
MQLHSQSGSSGSQCITICIPIQSSAIKCKISTTQVFLSNLCKILVGTSRPVLSQSSNVTMLSGKNFEAFQKNTQTLNDGHRSSYFFNTNKHVQAPPGAGEMEKKFTQLLKYLANYVGPPVNSSQNPYPGYQKQRNLRSINTTRNLTN